jgi:hypothetical protein
MKAIRNGFELSMHIRFHASALCTPLPQGGGENRMHLNRNRPKEPLIYSPAVIPAKAGIHNALCYTRNFLGSRLRGNDAVESRE